MWGKLTRSEMMGLTALLLAFLGQVFLGALAARSRPSEERGVRVVSWQEQERAVQQKVQDAFSLDRQEFEDRLRKDPALLRKFGFIMQGFLLLVAGSAFFFFRALVRLWQKRPVHPPLGEIPPSSWGLRDIFRILLWGVVFVQGVILAERAVFFVFQPAWMDRHVLTLGSTLLLDGLILALAVRVIRQADTLPSAASAIRQVRFAVVEYLAFLPVLFLLLLAVAAVMRLLGQPPPTQPVFVLYFSEGRAPVLQGLVFLVTVVGPVAEEFFFRGVLYRWLRTRWDTAQALVASAFFFALLHGDPVAFAPIFGLGLLFGWVYERTGSLLAPVSIHVAHNAGMLTLASLVKGLASL